MRGGGPADQGLGDAVLTVPARPARGPLPADRVRQPWAVPDRCLSWNLFIRSFAEVAPSGRAFLDGHFLDMYAARAHNNGTVGRFVEDALALTHKQRTEDMQRFLDAFLSHDTSDRLLRVAVPALVLTGRRDSTSRPEPCRSVAGSTPGAIFEVIEQGSPPAVPRGPGPGKRPRACLLARG